MGKTTAAMIGSAELEDADVPPYTIVGGVPAKPIKNVFLMKKYNSCGRISLYTDSRLTLKHGTVEFLTTLRYIEKYIRPENLVIEIGAGTGRYIRGGNSRHMFFQFMESDKEIDRIMTLCAGKTQNRCWTSAPRYLWRVC